MDYSDALGTEFREVRDVEHEGNPARAVEGSRFYSTGTDDLWHALTNAERLPRWFLPIRGDLRLGGRYHLQGNAEGTITRCDPPEALDVTWEYAGNVSWVSLRLAPENDGARLTLVHTMLKDEAGEAHWETYGPGATGVGWDLSFLGLGLHLESGGGTIDREASEAWLTSDQGKGFLRACAESWGRAHVEAGKDAKVAQAMAARAASFFAGE
ncbi:MAG: SRPBCC family protein [Thermoanaerobaculia bacterium]